MTRARPSLLTAAAAIALCVTFGTFGTPAFSQTPPAPVTQENATALATALGESLKTWIGSTIDATVEWQGQVLAVPTGDRYQVSLPPLTLKDGDGARFEVGSIRMELTPQADDAYGVTMTLPTAMTFHDKGGLDATLALGRQQFKGVWSQRYENFLTMDAAFGDISLTSARDEGELSIGALTVMEDLKPDGGGSLFSGPATLALSDVSFADGPDPEEDEIFSLGGLTIEGSYTRIDLAKLKSITNLARTMTAAKTEPKPDEVLALMQNLMGGANFRARLTDLELWDESSETTVSLDQLAIRGGADSMDKALSSASFGFEGRGLSIDPVPGPEQFVPQMFNLQVSVSKIPSGILTGIVSAAAAPGPGPAKDPAELGLAAVTEAGTELTIDAFQVDVPVASTTITGGARFARDAALGGVANVSVELRGLDNAVKALQPKGKKPDPATQDALGFLTMLQAMGQASKDSQGRDLRTYKFELTAQGQFLLNGADMGPLLGAMGGGPAGK